MVLEDFNRLSSETQAIEKPALTCLCRVISRSIKFKKSPSLLLLLLAGFWGAVGCATEDDQKNLEKRVAVLEEKQKASDEERRGREQAEHYRQEKLEGCVEIDADTVYWNYIKLNGKAVAGKPGMYTAAQYHWDQAEKMKRDKVEECKLLYGPR